MPIPKLYHLYSIDLERPALPADPRDCEVLVQAEIGFGGLAGADEFAFSVVTPSRLVGDGTRWGRGYLIVPEFSWQTVERAVERLLMHADRPTWAEAAAELTKEMRWEFEHYTP
jgi:Immunity protein 8